VWLPQVRHLRRRVLDRSLGALQPPTPIAVSIPWALPVAAPVVHPPAGPLPRLQALPRRACARRGGSDRSGRRGLRLPPAAPRSAHPSAAMLESACFPWEHLLLGFPAVIGHDLDSDRHTDTRESSGPCFCRPRR